MLVVEPQRTAEVAEVVKYCGQHGLPIVARGGGTSLEGHCLPPAAAAVVLDMTGMNAVHRVSPKDRSVTVGPGVGYVELNEYLQEHCPNFWFPLDPGPGATLGGMASTRCSGSTACRYGTFREAVLELEVVLASGDVVRVGSKAWKSAAGYDLKSMFVGAEGTLGIITEATVRIYPKPSAAATLLVVFKSTARAAEFVCTIATDGHAAIQRAELMDAKTLEILQWGRPPAAEDPTAAVRAHPAAPAVWLELTGFDANELSRQSAYVERVAREECGAVQVDTVLDEALATALWRQRKEALWTTMRFEPESAPWITDVCVPLSQLPEMLARTEALLQSETATGAPVLGPIISHAADGNIHVVLMKNEKNAAAVARLSAAFVEAALELGGTCTGEHGVGTGKKAYLAQEVGPSGVELMRAVKGALDPQRVLNPGKVFDME